MPVAFKVGGRYENPDGAYTVLEIADGQLRVLTDDGRTGKYTIQNQLQWAKPTMRLSPLVQREVPPEVSRLAEIFRRNAPGWEVYSRPHLNGLQPDLVLLNPQIGVALYRISDLDADALTHEGEALIADLTYYKQELLDLYCPRLGLQVGRSSGAFALVTTGLVFTKITGDVAVERLRPTLERRGLLGAAAPYVPICGADAAESRDIFSLLPSARFRGSKYMTAELANDLRARLYEPDHVAASRESLQLDERQRRLARSRTETGFRRIQGPAGSGKSLVLAARAAELAMQGKAVLVVSFNITLLQYLRSLAMRYPAPGVGLTNRVTWTHFHGWCKGICQRADMMDAYSKLWNREEDDTSPVLEGELPALASAAFDQHSERLPTYDAILVDEGQDFSLEWWNVLRRALRPNGEMLLVADETQDLYERARNWTDEKMSGAGFRGNWTRLEASYRLPADFVPHLRTYAEGFLQDEEVKHLPTAAQLPLLEPPTQLRWVQVEPDEAVDACVREVKVMPVLARGHGLPYSDVTLLTASHADGLACVRGLEEAGISVAHIFGRTAQEQRRLKLEFSMSDARAKACTVHSFKDWESRSMVVLARGAKTLADRALLYVALSRLKRHALGSCLTVVCAAPELEAYGRTWPTFELAPPVEQRVVHDIGTSRPDWSDLEALPF